MAGPRSWFGRLCFDRPEELASPIIRDPPCEKDFVQLYAPEFSGAPLPGIGDCFLLDIVSIPLYQSSATPKAARISITASTVRIMTSGLTTSFNERILNEFFPPLGHERVCSLPFILLGQCIPVPSALPPARLRRRRPFFHRDVFGNTLRYAFRARGRFRPARRGARDR